MAPVYSKNARTAFTLVELSIVLVILGLLVGGVLTGQSLIHAAELRSITTDIDKDSTALYTFRDKYFGLPGDITNATKFWGTDPGGCPTHAPSAPTTATCDGDGDGSIYIINESFRAWQQLAAAGLIEGTFTGVTGTATNHQSVPASNVPKLKLGSNLGITLADFGAATPSGSYAFPGTYGNTLLVGGCNGFECADYGIKPEDAYNIDTKLDDGKPGTGKLKTRVGSGSNGGVCNSATDDSYASAASAVYQLDQQAAACAIYFSGGL